MLILSRTVGEELQIGDDITLKVVKIGAKGIVRVGIEAPRSVFILRGELVKHTDGDRLTEGASDDD